ncbi:MAG: hypothetical protein KGI70_00270 [Patescibacteria group bacterium]|nr:hypothetical protein [Patescibacteria group bacterium]
MSNNSFIGTVLGNFVSYIVNPALLLLFAAAFLVFVYGLVKFIAKTNFSGQVDTDGKKQIWWGIAGMFIMVSAWAVIMLIRNTIGPGSF